MDDHCIGNKTLPEPMMTKFTDAYVSPSLSEFIYWLPGTPFTNMV